MAENTKFIFLKECPSTNDEAWSFLEHQQNSKLPTPGLVVAERQTAGRGRQNRSWQSDASGNFYGSFFTLTSVQKSFTWVPLAAGLAAAEALEFLAPDFSWSESDFRLKWPNDLYFSRAKCGGILCESRLQAQGKALLVIGLGLNLAFAPQIENQETTSLKEKCSKEISIDDFSKKWVERILLWLKELEENRTEGLRLQWLKRAKFDRFLDYQATDKDGAIVFVEMLGLDPFGRLQVRRKDTGEQLLLDQPEFLG